MFDLVNLIDFFHRGGIVLVFIFATSLLLWFFLIKRYIYIKFSFKSSKNALLNEISKKDFDKKFSLHVKEYAISNAKIKLSKNASYIKTLIVITPLLGLLGTVTGMISIFDVLSYDGSNDIKLMASGISMATIPTMAGMVVALSGMLFEKRIDSMSKNAIHTFYSQSQKAIQ